MKTMKTIKNLWNSYMGSSNQDQEDEYMSDVDSESQYEKQDIESNLPNNIVDPLDSLNARNNSGKSALYKAVDKENEELIDDLIKEKADLNLSDNVGNSPLHIAAEKSNVEPLNKLINADVRTNVQNNLGETALHKAVEAGKIVNITKLLQADNSLINTPTYRPRMQNSSAYKSHPYLSSPLHYALSQRSSRNNFNEISSENPMEIVHILLSAGVDINSRDENGITSFYLLISHPNINSLSKVSINQLLEKADLSIVKNKQTILHAAARNKSMSKEIFATILNKCLNKIDLVNDSKNTALYYAVTNEDLEKTELLLGKNANPNIHGNSTALHEAVKKDNLSLSKMLVDNDADVDILDNLKNSVIIYAAESGNLEIAKLLINAKCDLSGQQGELAVKKALINNNIDCLLEIISAGANPDVHVYPSYGNSSNFEFSSPIGFSKISSNSTPSANDGKDKTGYLKDGDTPLHFAVMTGNKELAILCRDKKPAMVNSQNKKGLTPASYAIKILSSEMACILNSSNFAVEEKPQAPGLTNNTYLTTDIRYNTLLMQGATRGFRTVDELARFFSDPDYQLSEKQIKMKEEVLVKYKPKVQNVSER